ncbi:MAG: M28 family peptidase [Alphaproteobacteria bacterium]|nr:M28 family peptidase [Alphaproteobacteria bacterium]MBV9692310.1 M28 family peptidase [Alphaproteobacteria bacterium]
MYESDCHHRNNGTGKRLLECIKAEALWRHLANFQAIADANPGAKGHGNRDTGTSGYLASVNYVAALMQQAGYAVQIQSYAWKHSVTVGTPRLIIDGRAYTEGEEWFVADLSGSGSVDAPLDVPHDSDGSGSGCAPAAFGGFRKGGVALLKRGACEFDIQVANAKHAGAAAVVLCNDRAAVDAPSFRRHGDGSAFAVQLTREAGIPVIGALAYDQGSALAAQVFSGHAPMARIAVRTETKSGTDYNVIAESPYGDPDRTIVVDAHLDSIYGAGVLDNASGSATILEIARNLADTPTPNRLRYIWFGGEEIGLLGSRYYTHALSKAEIKQIAFDIDVDVTATPNYAILIADPGHAHGADKFPPNVVPASQIGNRRFEHYFRKIGIPARIASFGNDGTDSLAFSRAGVPNTGILTQQNCCKHAWEVRLWGGFLGNFEGKIPGHNGGCVDWPRRWCDNLSNTDREVLEFVSKATAAVVLQFANDAAERRK